MSNLTLGSLFDGSGGFPLGGLLSGITPVFASEIEPFPIRVTTKRLPQVKHLGDISKINGAEIEPVDIITFGSPCTDLSIAGKRAGLEGSKSSLFYEAIRIVKEMRCQTNGEKPRFIVWENVCGAFSSNKGEDFRSVLEEIGKIADETLSIAKPSKWENAGEVMGEEFSLAWRVLDAQFWGVPQRRKRIYLVADFGGRSASKILFESEGLSWYSAESFRAWQESAEGARDGTSLSSIYCLNDQGGERMDVTEGMTATLRATSNHPPLVFENHSQDTRFKGPLETAQTVLATYGTGGNNQPFVVEDVKTYDVRFTSEGTINSRANVYESETSRTIDTSGNAPDSNQGGIAVVSVRGSMIGRADENGPQGSGTNEDVSFTLNTVDRHGVAYPTYSASKNSHFTKATKELAGTLVATDYKDPPLVNDKQYVVRRLTPTECARLQGFPSWWCSELETAEPTEADLVFFRDVFETYRLAVKPNVKPKTDKQIEKWLREPYSDSAAYKMWGNGVALPCVVFVLSGILWEVENGTTK
ncbi:DNA (cytosine-5-)-methyltransferase [Enterococcus asini ATCC 700915]|uniref:Cytosine-specific methyltransferase n=1 Tax=Enterococcus asini ATCC 700915 TaxID=1158606 RepID=R2RVA2_9ENTE|nr:DNA (cytosine-5-)-methyltransferase [Enterococcus asini]EOH87245.1 DNA (cytosine-5-)-methyltransferase [Enterococcus asini ATCC 700915]EOT58349.1 hypothetical protein I579_01913 [Enterococcus asini ATCC 700915]